jgi:hypothetical protein
MKNLVLLTAVSLLLVSCKENSPLSDVEIINPALISPEITLSKHENELGRTNTSVKVYLNDKNNNSIDLLKGSVQLNNTTLGVHTEFGGAPYYSLENIELVPKRKYRFNIKMAHEKVYPCSINSPEKTLGELNVPDYHDRNTPLILNFGKLNSTGTEYVLEIRSDEGLEEILLSSFEIGVGRCIIPPRLFSFMRKDKQNDVLITLTSIISGNVDPQFNGGSIKIVESISRQVTLGDGVLPMVDDKGYPDYISNTR